MQERSTFGPLSLAVLILSIVALGALVFETFFKIHPEASKILNYLDYGICVFFLFEFFYQLSTAKSKLEYLKWGWIDLLSSIPTMDILRMGRLFRIIRIIRIIKTFKSLTLLVNHIFKDKAKGTLSSTLVLAVIMILFSSIAILEVEDSPLSNIKTAEDALWWSYTTITTVGYGDKFPVTNEGRIIAIILMTFGVGMFGTFTAYIASFFVKSK
jgi:voltage-gated potassium channel